MIPGRLHRLGAGVTLLAVVAACAPAAPTVVVTQEPAPTVTPDPRATMLPTRTLLSPGELVPYTANSGDTLPAVAAHFNTTVEEIRAANPDLPELVTTLPAGYPLTIPAYYVPLTGTPFQILPDSEVPNGPSAVEFDLRQEVLSRAGYLASVSEYAFGRERVSWELVNTVALNYSIHPRLLLTLLEYGSSALTNPFPGQLERRYPLGFPNVRYQGVYRQLLWAAERINDGFYGWRAGSLREFETSDGFLIRPDSWQNAGTVAIQYLLAGMMTREQLELAIGPGGFHQTYVELWGDPFGLAQAHIPGNLQQPELGLPFLPNRVWDFSGGPHSSWGESLPWGALDFAPPAVEGGCASSNEWAAAPAPGVITRSGNALAVLDLDGDGDERTGWVLLFYHLAENGLIAAGTEVELGDRLGHPSCEGGRSTGTHFHIARRYNGEWLPADGPVPFMLDRWEAHAGDEPYEGQLTRGTNVVPACTCSTRANRIIYQIPGESETGFLP